MVHVSTTGAFQARRFETCYPVSACFDEVSPRRVDILGRVFVAVVVCATLWASPLSGIEKEPVQNVATGIASLGRGEEAVHKPQLPTVALTLVGEHLANLTERSIGDRLRKGTALHHPLHVQILDADPVVSTNQIGSHLVEVVLPGVANMFLHFGNADALPIPPATPFGATGENPLFLGKASLVFARVLRVGDSRSVAESCEAIDPKVNPHSIASGFELGKLFVEDQRNEVSSARSLGDCDSGRLGLELPTPIHVQATQSTDNQIRVVRVGTRELEGRVGVLSTLLVPLLFEGGVTALLFEKAQKSRVQVPQRLLRRNTGHFAQPRRFGVFLPLGQFSGTRVVVHALLPMKPSIRAHPQCAVVNVAAASKDLCQFRLLANCRVEPELVSNLHTENGNRVRNNVNNNPQKRSGDFSPA